MFRPILQVLVSKLFLGGLRVLCLQIRILVPRINLLNRKLVNFFDELGFFHDVAPFGEAPKKQKKRYVETFLLVEVATKEERRVIFVE